MIDINSKETNMSELPELHNPGGFRGGYRLFTNEDAPYMGEGVRHSTLVTVPGPEAGTHWCVSYASGPIYDGVVLSAFLVDVNTSENLEDHKLDGTLYRGSRREANEAAHRAAYEAGLLAYMVYERQP